MAEKPGKSDVTPSLRRLLLRATLGLAGAASVGGVGVATYEAGKVEGYTKGFGDGVNAVVEVGPRVVQDKVNEALKAKTERLNNFGKEVTELLKNISSQIFDFLSTLQKKASTPQNVWDGVVILGKGLIADGAEFVGKGESSLDQTMEGIRVAVEKDPELGPQWKSITATYEQLKEKQIEASELFKELAVSKEDINRWISEVRTAVQEEALSTQATSVPKRESQE